MICYQGKTVYSGMAAGTAYVLRKPTANRGSEKAVNAFEELRRIELAVDSVIEDLEACMASAESEAERDVLEIHRMMLEDEDVIASLRNAVENDGLSAEDAVAQTEHRFVNMLLDTHDDYMMARADDVRDICGRLTASLSGDDTPDIPRAPFVLVADELLPGDLLRFKGVNLTGIVMRSGTLYSHTSILIREMRVPALICGGIDGIKTGMRVLLNADSGKVCFDPDDEAETSFAHSMVLETEKETAQHPHKLPCALCVNIAGVQEGNEALLDQCDGVGLFRTEFLFIGRSDLPDEEEQFQAYKSVLCAAKGKPVTIRTFDLGADKQSASIPLAPESNPALGCRGLRVYSVYPQVFQTQLRALLRAAVYGDSRIMFPMVTCCSEIEAIRRHLSAAAETLTAQGVLYRIPLLGAMIETPAAVMLSEELAGCVDFFSVGTNDLTQYTFAIDRQSANAVIPADEEYEALLRLIRIAADNAHKAGIKIGICGELAADPTLLQSWTEMGIDSLSVAPSALKLF